ncbi:MAG TPA: LysE family translocator [Steroidobacteraceae bacterium]|nr:LysE family translocator [Steroidobacteraceae bacterium]
MLGIHDYWLFIATGILLNLTPGQDTMYILGRSLSGGLRAGVASALGISVGSIAHTLAAAAGLSLLLATSVLAFTLVKLAGGAYLLFLGVRLLFTNSAKRLQPDPQVKSTCGSAAHAFAQGILTNVLNPKVALFFLAFLPQFISPASPTKTLAFLALGATFIATGTIWCLVLALAAARLRGFLARNPGARTLIDRATGGLFVLLGARLAFSR